MSEFIKSALPFVLMGASIALFFVDYAIKYKEKTKNEKPDFSGMGILFGAAIGIAVGSTNSSIGTGLGAGIGMLIGTICEIFAKK